MMLVLVYMSYISPCLSFSRQIIIVNRPVVFWPGSGGECAETIEISPRGEVEIGNFLSN